MLSNSVVHPWADILLRIAHLICVRIELLTYIQHHPCLDHILITRLDHTYQSIWAAHKWEGEALVMSSGEELLQCYNTECVSIHSKTKTHSP